MATAKRTKTKAKEEKVTNTHSPYVHISEDVILEILERVTTGESINKICNDQGMPARKSFYSWLARDESLRKRYEQATLARTLTMAEELLDIADEPVGSLESGATDTGAVQKQRLQVDTRKWILSKLVPKKYGERVVQDLTSSDGSMAPQPIDKALVTALIDKLVD